MSHPTQDRPWWRYPAVLWAWVAYVSFARSMLYLIAFVANVWVGRTIDTGSSASLTKALWVDTALLLIFVLPHSLMARRPFKTWLSRFWPPLLERSTYVLVSSLLLMLLLWQWRPLPAAIWDIEGGLATVLRALSLAGWGFALFSSYRLGHGTTFGLHPVWSHARGRRATVRPLVTRFPYSRLRHPMYLGFLIGIWATPRLSEGHLLFSCLLTVYLLIARFLEERDLEELYGEIYTVYRRRVPAFLPLRRRISLEP